MTFLILIIYENIVVVFIYFIVEVSKADVNLKDIDVDISEIIDEIYRISGFQIHLE